MTEWPHIHIHTCGLGFNEPQREAMTLLLGLSAGKRFSFDEVRRGPAHNQGPSLSQDHEHLDQRGETGRGV